MGRGGLSPGVFSVGGLSPGGIVSRESPRIVIIGGGAGGRPIFSEIVHQFHSRSHTYLSLASSSLRRLLVSAELKLKATRRFGDILTDVFYCVIFACVLVKF